MFFMKTGHGSNCCVFISRKCTYFVLNSTELKIIIYIYIYMYCWHFTINEQDKMTDFADLSMKMF